MRATVIGGDRRMYYAATELESLGWQVELYGHDSTPRGVSTLSEVSRGMGGDALVLPVPARGYPEREAAELFCRYGCVYGGGLSAYTVSEIHRRGSDVYDLLTDEPLVLANAELTAEAALSLGMTETGISPACWQAAVIGGGRIGKCMVEILSAMGSTVTLFARSTEQRWWAESRGACSAGLHESAALPLNIMFNTAPAALTALPLLQAAQHDCVVIDLASGGCIDPDGTAARVVSAPGLPGRYFPRTAGQLIGRRINDIARSHHDI